VPYKNISIGKKGNLAFSYLAVYILFLIVFVFLIGEYTGAEEAKIKLDADNPYANFNDPNNSTAFLSQQGLSKPQCSFGAFGVDGAFACLGSYAGFLISLGFIDSTVGGLNALILFPMSIIAILAVFVLIRG